MYRPLPPSLFTLLPLARRMRRNPTRSERILWEALRGERIGVHFRRQHPLGRAIVDFYAATRRLVVEIDGGSHTGREEADARRDAELVSLFGVRILRVSARDVERDVAAVVARIREAAG